ncbi:hypothetical protein SDC9_108739 [bioreactor metagenome]|uniref:Uncharacterized protein n=1 Tax=bioreactor metagenome TaxID=1076179 RepID=A0A645B9Z4_9ZZZZ
MDGHGASGAGGLLRCAAGTDEVGVGRAARVGGEVQQHPRPTGAAVQQAFQVVGVRDVPCHLGVAGLQQRLHLVEQRGFDQWLVRAGVQGSLVADHSGVVRVREQLVEGVLPERLRRALRRWHGGQASRGEVAQQPGDRGLALGVGLERPPDQRRTFGIDLDGANLTALGVGAADVEVADRGAHRRAALRELLRQPFGDFGGEVAGVELCDGRHDPVDEHPGGRLVDGLGSRHERHPSGEQSLVNLHVIGTVASEPVELVHDAERHPGGGDEREHVLEPVAIRRPGRLSGVDELAHDLRTQFVGLPRVRLTLRGDGEALVGAAAFGLLAGGDTEVGRREQYRSVCLNDDASSDRGAHGGPPCRGTAWSRFSRVPLTNRSPELDSARLSGSGKP